MVFATQTPFQTKMNKVLMTSLLLGFLVLQTAIWLVAGDECRHPIGFKRKIGTGWRHICRQNSDTYTQSAAGLPAKDTTCWSYVSVVTSDSDTNVPFACQHIIGCVEANPP